MKKNLIKVIILTCILSFTKSATSQNVLTDGNFNTTTFITPLGAPPVPLNTWCSWKNEATVSSFSAIVSGGVCSYSFYNSGNNTWDVQLIQFGFPLEKGNKYKLSFDVKSDAERNFGVFLGENEGSWTNLNAANYFQHSTTGWETKTIHFVATSVFALHKLSFELGAENSKTYFDNIVLENLGPAKVFLPGNFQSEIGCGADWMADGTCSELTYNSSSGKWEGSISIPAGCWEYKVAHNGSWDINYGLNGEQNGSNIQLFLSSNTLVSFSYDPITHIVISSPASEGCLPNTVVLPGNFQSELGCTGDWQPDCNFTRLTYNPTTKLWIGTFNIPAGNWEYKVAYNNTWDENYGLNGISGGPNIPLNLCVPSTITFKYNYITHLVALEYQTSGICVTKFYDANANGYNDDGIPLAGIEFKLSGTSSATQYTGTDGKTSFTGLVPGHYTVTETVPLNWIPTTVPSQDTTLGAPVEMYFGNVCLGPGGGHSMGYWMNKNGQATLTNSGQMEWILWDLKYFSLKDANGNDFDPNNYAELRDWMQKASASNMAYMLSAQMVAMYLNIRTGMVKYNSIVYAPGCGDYGMNNQFINIWSLIWNTNYSLMYNGYTPASNVNRSYQECLKNVLDKANNNLNFVQQTPCSLTSAPVTRISDNVLENRITDVETKVWPNPASTFFNLSVGYAESNELVHLNVYDVNGKLVYSMNGPANKVYQFGQGFIPGVYLAEIKQGTNRKTVKLVKQ